MNISGLRLQTPGALYWFNMSLVFLFITSFQSLSAGTFPGVFVVAALAAMSLLGLRYPLLSAESALKTYKGYGLFLLYMFVMCNVADYIFHKPTSISGAMAVLLIGGVGFQLGRYARIGRFGLVDEKASKIPDAETEPLV